jgi:hypothetical protein
VWGGMKEGMWLCMTKKISSIFKFSYKNISTKISILNQVSDNENHVWHAQSHYKLQTLGSNS